MELIEPVEHPASFEDKETELDGQPARSRIESGLIEPDDLDALLRDVRPRLERGRSRRGAVPELKHEETLRFEMSAYAAKGLQRIALRQQIAESPEHANGHVEPFAKLEGPHVGSDEPRSRPQGGALFPREGKHLAGPVDSRDAVPASEWK